MSSTPLESFSGFHASDISFVLCSLIDQGARPRPCARQSPEQTLERLIAVCRPPEVKPSARTLGVPRVNFSKQYPLGSAAQTSALVLDVANGRGAVGTKEGKLNLFSLDQPANVTLSLAGHHGPVSTLQFHPSRPLLLSGSADRQVHMWMWPPERRSVASPTTQAR